MMRVVKPSNPSRFNAFGISAGWRPCLWRAFFVFRVGVEYVNDPKRTNTIDTLSVAMVANNIGHAEDSNRSGKFHGSFT